MIAWCEAIIDYPGGSRIIMAFYLMDFLSLGQIILELPRQAKILQSNFHSKWESKLPLVPHKRFGIFVHTKDTLCIRALTHTARQQTSERPSR